MSSLCGSRFLAHGTLALSLLSLILAAPARGDELSDQRARKDVDAQRINQMVRDTEDIAAQLARQKNLTDAVAVLRRALSEVEDSKSLTDERRDKLSRELKGMIRSFDPKTVVTEVPVIRPTRPPGDDNRGPTDTAGKIIQGRTTAQGDLRDLNRQREVAFNKVNRSVIGATVMPDREYTLPANWVELTKRRSKVTMTMTDRERAILRELNSPRSVNFTGMTFEEAINYLAKSMGQTINTSKAELEAAGVTYDTPIKLEMKNVATRSILKKMLAELNLTYIIKDEAIEVVTPERAKATLTTRTFYVGDLLPSGFQTPYSQAAMIQQINQIAVMIQQSYDPNSWQSNGGPGSITFDPISMSFVIRQTAEMHFLMGVGTR